LKKRNGHDRSLLGLPKLIPTERHMSFKDYFSKQAGEYSKYRPSYPEELFTYLSSLAKEHKRSWDCATGNGQAALGHVPFFDEIIATDASESQIKHAKHHSKIIYKVATAEDSGLETASIDLITVATAIHWINTDLFYPEAKRIMKREGVIAVWTYPDSNINEKIDHIIHAYLKDIIGMYWPKEIEKVWNFEESIDFPFEKIESPDFSINAAWTMKDYMNYLYTWSATQNYISETGENPLKLIYDDLLKAWGNERQTVTWKLKMKVGRNT
jgi:ubiquinone/menaquinone biosynthesis C-methylase UbiE